MVIWKPHTFFDQYACPALCLAIQLFANHSRPVEFHLLYNWLGVFGLGFPHSHVFSEMRCLYFFKQQMLAPLCSLDNLEELLNVLA